MTMRIWILSLVTMALAAVGYLNSHWQWQSLAGLEAGAQISYDQRGVLYIEAKNSHDLYFAQGYGHAGERLWQMEFQRRVGSGTLSEVVGSAALESDRFMRTLGLRQAAEQAWPALSPAAQEAVDAYVAGINAYIAKGEFPLEFRLLEFEPKPFNRTDVLLWPKVVSLQLAGNMEEELTRYRLLAGGLSPERLAELMPVDPDTPAEDPYLPPIGDTGLEIVQRALPKTREASNNWVVGKTKSASGFPLLANDPHLGLQAPSVWILNSLKAPGLEVYGASFPGVPGVVIGRNNDIAWGVTNAGTDVQDLYVLEESKDGRFYRYQDQWEPFTTRSEKILVKDSPTEELTVRETRYGPVIEGEKQALALRWVSLDSGDRTLEAFLRVNQAHNLAEFQKALAIYRAPAQNFVYADREHIALFIPGAIPVRAPSHSGAYPVPATQAFAWQGFAPDMPKIIDPESGFIATANQRVAPPGSVFLTADYSEPLRGQRIAELLQAQDQLSALDMAKIQLDSQTPLYQMFRPLLAQIEPNGYWAKLWQKRILNWDGVLDIKEREGAVFEAWYQELSRLPAAETGEESWDRPSYLIKALTEGDPNCGPSQDCRDFATRAWEKAVARYSGAVPTWGQLHQARFANPILDATPLARWASPRVPHPGDTYTVNVGRYEADFAMYHGPSYRQVFDLRQSEPTIWSAPPGQSGKLWNSHYADQIGPWANSLVLDQPSIKRKLYLNPELGE